MQADILLSQLLVDHVGGIDHGQLLQDNER
jgi:hypothetical protein